MIKTVWAGFRKPIRNMLTNRNISQTFPRREKPPATVSSEPVTEQVSSPRLTYVVKPYQKYILVWAGTYKSIADVPERVGHGALDAALNKVRVKVAIYMMIATVLMAGAATYSGKKAAERGDSLARRGEEHHRKLREEATKEREAVAVKSAQ